MTLIEFYDGDAKHPFVSVDASSVPREGDLINIRKETWRVVAVTWAVDQPTGERPKLRANVTLEHTR